MVGLNGRLTNYNCYTAMLRSGRADSKGTINDKPRNPRTVGNKGKNFKVNYSCATARDLNPVPFLISALTEIQYCLK